MSYSEKTPDLKHEHTIDSVSGDDGEVGRTYEIDSSNIKQTKRHLLPRHIQLIAISGAIGTGLFVSTFSKAGVHVA